MNERFKIIREKLGLTQEEMGNALGIGRSAVSKIENGANALTEANILCLCRLFNVNEQWLRNGGEIEPINPTPSDELDALVKKYGLSRGDYVLIEKFINLKSEQRAAVVEYVRQVAAALQGSDISAPVVSSAGSFNIENMTDAELAAIIRNENSIEKSTEEK